MKRFNFYTHKKFLKPLVSVQDLPVFNFKTVFIQLGFFSFVFNY